MPNETANGKSGGAAGGTRPFFLLLCAALAFTAVVSFATWDPEREEGELYAAAVSLRDALSENEAAAVFLGLSPGEETEPPASEERNAARDAYVDVYNALHGDG